MTSELAENLARVRERIATACARANRSAGDVRILAVTKTVPVERIRDAVGLGLTLLGENRVQEAAEKVPAVGAGVEWHLVGHLQTNKAKKAVELFAWVHSVDSVHVAEELSRRAAAAAKTLDVLVELNLSGDASKTGLPLGSLDPVLAGAARPPALRLRGLMTMGPVSGDPGATRSCFVTLRETLVSARARHGLGSDFSELSMGMSDDFEIAVEEGATILRLGRALFGPRRA